MTALLADASRPWSLRAVLRARTQAAHATVDAALWPYLAGGDDGYAKFLRASAGALLPLERALEAAGVARYVADWPERRRSAAVLADLASLGTAPPAPAAVPPVRSEAHAFGMLYTLEGSRLGARAVLPGVLASAGARVRGAVRFLDHGEARLWPDFLERLEASRAARRAPDEAVEGALAAFGAFEYAARAVGEGTRIGMRHAG